jgi:hypothetical protein
MVKSQELGLRCSLNRVRTLAGLFLTTPILTDMIDFEPAGDYYLDMMSTLRRRISALYQDIAELTAFTQYPCMICIGWSFTPAFNCALTKVHAVPLAIPFSTSSFRLFIKFVPKKRNNET